MSTIYITEPPTKGKVLLKTSLGDVDIELWAKEAPKAVRNFVQLCLEGYYDNTLFHRVIKNFIAQGGDPTGTGEGGESIYGEPFPDEFHSRLRFNRRGLVAMASSGPCTNQSQFFITLDKTEELQRKHTIFGKVTGETVFNILRLNEYDVDENDRPVHEAKIISTEVLWNPFEDIVPREKPKVVEQEVEEKPKIVAKKNMNLLSFGDEEEDGEESVPTGMKSSHHFPSKMMEEAILKKKQMGLEDDVDTNAYPLPSASSSKGTSKPAEGSKAQPTKHKAKKQRKNYNEEDGEAEVEEEEEEQEEEGMENMDFGDRMRAKILAQRKKYEPDALVKKPKKEAKDDSDDDDDDSDDDGLPKKEVDEVYRRKESKLFFKKPVQTEAAEVASLAHKRHAGKLNEKSLLDKLEVFRKGLKNQAKGEDDEWKGHSLVFEKEQVYPDAFKARDDGYQVYDPLKSQKEKQKNSNANSHQRRLLAVKNLEKW